MRYLILTEYDPVALEVATERDSILQTERAMRPEKYPKYVLKTSLLQVDLPKLTGRIRLVDVVDVDNVEQLNNVSAYWYTQMTDVKTMKRWCIPLHEITEATLAEMAQSRKLVEKTIEQRKASR